MRHDDEAMRPRGEAWGSEAQRAVLQAVVEDVARRSGFRVAAIEVLRSDGNLEFVAIAGSAQARAELLGKAAPLQLDHIVANGTSVEGWIHIPAEAVDDATREWIDQYGHTPDLPEPAEPDGWRAQDRLVRLLESPDGELRATLYLDEPLDGQRPTKESLAAVNAEVEVLYDAVVGIVERELYGEQVRMVTQARSALQSVRPGLGVGDFLHEMADAMVAAMEVDTVDVLLAGDRAPDLQRYLPHLERHMHRVWLRRGHLIVEPTRTWGITETSVRTPDVLAGMMRRRGLGSWLLVPIGMGEEYLGTMGLGRRPGSPRWIDSEVNAAVAVAGDVADLLFDARLMERERRLNDELRDVDGHRREMVATLAHELRNPVTVLWSHLELLDEEDLPDAVRDSLQAMDRATRRIEDMVEDLMTLGKVSDPARTEARARVDLSALVRECVDFVAAVAEAGGLELGADVARGVVVDGDELGLQRMVSNLLSNALKYTPSGGRVTLTLAGADRDGARGALLTCADTGIGIDDRDRERVFTPFFRSGNPEARRRRGTGLGLAIVDQVVQRHGGRIDLHSRPGEGSTFTVWLPVASGAGVG